MSAVACVEKNAMFIVPTATPSIENTKEMVEKEQMSSLITSEKNALQLKQEKLSTLKNGLYTVGCVIGEMMNRLNAVSVNL